ncbi:MAG: Nif3-like dinuclear metal center hexameric protein [Bacteroidaceae bacterium]|nr:Nif3-like dinuclear metal center hexameric protein [Bacteroidaceae bacterium]
MSVRVQDVICALEDFAPLPLQESYDNAGLQVGLTETELSGVLLCLDVTEDVIREALELGCNMIVSHHPLIFHGLKHLTDADAVQRCVRMALQNDIAIYSAHTNLDSAVDGVNYMMAERLGLMDVVLLQPRQVAVGFGSTAHTVQAGSGVIGYLPDGEDSLAFLQRVKQAFGVECLMHNELLARPIQSVAICGGAGDFLLDEALNAQADAFLTGEMHYHQYFGHDGQIQIGVLGHYQSEQYTIDIFNSIIGEKCPRLPLFKTTICTNPIKYL